MSLLEVRDARVAYGGVMALDGVTVRLDEGELLAVLGPNGSGKTTLFNAISGVLRLRSGRVLLDGTDITRWPTYKRAIAGISRSFQSVEVFPRMTVLDSLRFVADTRKAADSRDDVDSIMHLLGLEQHCDSIAGSLSFGQQKLVAIGLALVGRPRLIMLDEALAAVNPTLARDIADRIVMMNSRGTTILLVEHNVPLAVAIASRLVVLDGGACIYDGAPSRVSTDEAVIAAYLGTGVE